MPGFDLVLFSRYYVVVFPSAFVFIISANSIIISIFIMVSVFCSPLISAFYIASYIFPASFRLVVHYLRYLWNFWIIFPIFSFGFCCYGRYVQ